MNGAPNHPWRLILRAGLRVGFTWFLLVAQAWAGGPRYVAGPPFFTGQAGVPVGWRQTQLNYTTDPGDLSAYVNHAAADAIVAAAANVWNLPVANITISQNGELAEDVSGANTYIGSTGLVFPADVMSTNAAAVPIAVIYDSDGAVTDLLLGSGASLPAECAQNGVTESVDSFDPAGYILHAIIVVNGRCTGSAPQEQLQLQYQLMRVFGRVLGLAWSQTNDNVFTGATTPTYAQELNWPIMHPIDIICGSYSYQCLVNPFQLRPDDIAAMVTVYPVTQSRAGKQVSLANATGMDGHVTFPSGQGMAGVNVLVKRPGDLSYQSSAVTGASFRRAGTSALVAAETDALSSMGTQDQNYEGWYQMQYIPMLSGQTAASLQLAVEPINPLYIGEHSVGPYAPGMVALSGTAPVVPPAFGVDEGGIGVADVMVSTAPAICGSGTDGTLSLPMEMPTTGWWNGLLCGYGHASYVGVNVKPARTFTVEVTALNEQGLATTAKAMPVIGIFAPTDQWFDLPSAALQATAFQGWTIGTTTLTTATGSMSSVRIGIADERGDGRPDFAYQARMFYADSVSPATIGAAGATVTITGSGFRSGNAVTINGVPVTVQSWSASAIVVKAPAMAAVKAPNKVGVDVQVSDLTTGATTLMSNALTYDADAGLPNTMRLISIQNAAMYAGDTAATPFAVQIMNADGVTPVAGETIVFSATAGNVQFGCGSATCSVVTNAQGVAQSSVTPIAAGTITLQAADGSLMQRGSFVVLPQVGSLVLQAQPTGALNVNVQATTPFAVQVVDASGNPIYNVPITFSVTAGHATFSKCANPVCVVMSDGGGGAGTWVIPASLGAVTIRASIGDAAVNDTFTGVSNADTMQITSTPAEPAYPHTIAGTFYVQLTTPQGNPDRIQPVAFTAPPGVQFTACGSNTCVATSDWNGYAGFDVVATTPGVYTLTATFGAITQTQVFTVSTHTYSLNVISTPGTNVAPMVASAKPFAMQLLEDGATPVSGEMVILSGAHQDVVMSVCASEICGIITDANGMVSTTVVPLRAGVIPLSAVFTPITVATSFTAVGVPDSLPIVATVAASGAVQGVYQFLEVRLIGPDGVTGIPYNDLTWTVTSGPFTFTSNCPVATCVTRTDTNGYAAIGGIPWGAGPVTIQVTNGDVTQVFQFNAVALPDVLQVVSAPASGGYASQTAALPFTVQAFFNGGVMAVSGRTVTVSVTSGFASLAVCAGASSCTLTTDANGKISTLVTPLAAGQITLQVNDGGVIAAAIFTAIPLPDVMVVESSPHGTFAIGAQTATPFSVGVFAGDGVTPRVGKSVIFSVMAGSAVLGCGSTTCAVLTSTNGMAAVTVTPLAVGIVQLSAVEGTLTQTVSFTAVKDAVTTQFVTVFVAEGATVPETLSLAATIDGNPAAGQAVHWTSSGGFALAASDSVTDVSGASSVAARLGPLAGGTQASATGCAWGNVCVSFNATGVAAANQQIVVASGGQQSTAGSVSYAPLQLEVVDGSGHPVVGAAVSVYQTVTAVSVSCPAQGRCPAAPVIATNVIEMTSGSDGMVWVTPLAAPSYAGETQTEIAASVGTQGFVTTVLSNRN